MKTTFFYLSKNEKLKTRFILTTNLIGQLVNWRIGQLKLTLIN